MKFPRLSALGLLLSGVFLVGAAAKSGPTILWPTPNPAFMAGGNISTWAQDTGTGDPHSGLFGCVRDNEHKFHEGIDIKCTQRDRKGDPLDPIYAAMDGQVVYINSLPGNSNYGRYIVIEHNQADVPVYTLYAHLAAIEPGLKAGQTVAAGATIARLGHSGTEKIPLERAHMHFEIGLRLTDQFQPWYDAKKFGSPNEHGLYNGMNLIGADPLAFLEAVRAGKFRNFHDYFREQPTAFTLRVSTARVPEFARRYPALLTKPVPPEGVAGWDVEFTWYGLPKQMTPLPPGAVGLAAPGTVMLVGYDRKQFDGCQCRETLMFNAAKPSATPKLGPYLTDVIKLLFGFK